MWLCKIGRLAVPLVFCALLVESNEFKHDVEDQTPDDKVTFDVKYHGPCTALPVSNEHVRFSDSRIAPVVPISNRPGCYSINGYVDVYKDLSSNIQAYVELRHKPDDGDSPPETCHKNEAESDRGLMENDKDKGDAVTKCGGFGSCVHCSACDQIQKYSEVVQLAEVAVMKNGSLLDCGINVPRGRHRDIELFFCVPTRRQYINVIGQDDAYARFKQIANLYEGKTSIEAWIKIYLFDFDVSAIHQHQQEIEPEQRRRFKVRDSDPLPMYVYNRLPFASFMNRQRQNATWIGCHAMQGTIALQSSRFRHW